MFDTIENVIDYDDITLQNEQSQMLHTTWEHATYVDQEETQQLVEVQSWLRLNCQRLYG